VARGRLTAPDGIPRDVTRLARLAGDAALGTREAFLAMLNATLPVKRVIAQGLIGDGEGRFLMCELLYKQEWDLPGGVVDPRESPAQAVVREVREELGATVEAGDLLALDWLPPYRQWEDALLCVFDLGEHPALVDEAVLETTEIRAVHWCDLEAARAHAAPYVVRLLEQVRAGEHTAYLEDGTLPA
jgi:8-oxo-dGTP pyrophosphatase MutT (NUDIX family)